MPMELTPQDRFAIQDVYAKYCRTVDLNDAEGWADTFTDDGKRIYDDNPGAPGRAGRTFVGRAALVKLQSVPRPLSVRHWHSLPVLTDKGDYIEGVVYGMVVDVSKDPPTIMAHFTYTDELVKLADGSWRMRSRASARDLLVLESAES
jgi:SnoaL-like domain